eukprot:Pgem_evm1s9984
MDEKKRRNCLASARFRQKKKQETLMLEAIANQKKDECDQLNEQVETLECEVSYLRQLLMMTTVANAAAALPPNMVHPTPHPSLPSQPIMTSPHHQPSNLAHPHQQQANMVPQHSSPHGILNIKDDLSTLPTQNLPSNQISFLTSQNVSSPHPQAN